MNHCLKTADSNCKNCYKCIRNCPIKALRMTDEQAHIIRDECILCGECYVVCPQNAKQIRNDADDVRELLASGREVIVSLAPSYAAWYRGFSLADIDSAAKKLGISYCDETAKGALIVKKEYEKLVNQRKTKVIISSCCHSVNLLIEKHFPGAVKYLANVVTPMHAHGKILKETHPDAAVVFVGPCISKKAEIEKYPGAIDVALTFEEFDMMLKDAGVEITKSNSAQNKHLTNLFPTSGGVLATMEKADDFNYLVIDGTAKCIEALAEIENGNLENCFIEMSACSGSCTEGPLMKKNLHNPLACNVSVHKDVHVTHYDVDSNGVDLARGFAYEGKTEVMPGSNAIEEVLRKMGKTSPEKHLNCGSCGYNTCREKAIAVLQGKADISMCLPYIKEKSESFSDTIIKNTPNGILVLDEHLNISLLNGSARKIFNLPNSTDLIGDPVVRLLDPTDYFLVQSTGKNVYANRKYLAEYEKYVEETIVYDREYHIIMIMMKDITQEEESKSRRTAQGAAAVEITDKVIEKQMRIVQEIASLLGETTAETKIALTKLKETLQDE
ncbi:MAG: PAS domain-containing protein [Clostridia bacterium]|nr:PAS domain-containing protein [Clostridia bacterium]